MENMNQKDKRLSKQVFDEAVMENLTKKRIKKLLNEEFNKQANTAQWDFLEIPEVN